MQERRMDEMGWLIGAYVQRAIASTPLTAVAALAEKIDVHKMPKYPDKPITTEKSKETEQQEMTQEQKRAESMKLVELLTRFGGNTSGVRFN